MCDPVSFASKHLLPLLAETVNMIKRVPVEVEAMRKQLETIQYMIHEADRKASAEADNLKRDEIEEMTKELLEAAFQMEDVLDEHIMCEKQLQSPRQAMAAFNPEEVANFIRPMITRVQLAYKIQNLNSRVPEIKKRCNIHDEANNLSPNTESSEQDTVLRNIREKAPLYIKETDVVGLEVPKAKLIHLLLKGQENRTVVAVVGMGGKGKTTLARKVFESQEVIHHFDCHAWVTVSQTYTVEILLRDMLEQFCKIKTNSHISTLDRKSLGDEVRNYLREKRYVVFLDDVWKKNLWDEIEFDMIDNTKKSRIFITTQKTEVALHFKKSSIVEVHDMELLDQKQSFDLFCKKAFLSDYGGVCPKELEGVSCEIVKKCDGLPLAITVIGGVLSTKDPSEWTEFSENLSSELESNPDLDHVTKILTSSYHDLPSNLKPCLLYFGMYPGNLTVSSKRLISQWIAEGFIEEQNNKTLEKVAEGYLKELINRSLVQVSSLSIDGKAKSCRLHDLVREVILRKMKNLKFCQCINEGDHHQSAGKSRRLSIATSSEALDGSPESSHIRSLLFFKDKGSPPEHLMKRIPVRCKLLKVLDFENLTYSCKNFPENLLNLLHLKYLSLRRMDLSGLPESIVKLQNLETLDVRGNGIMPLPMEISKLRNLRHLWGYFHCLSGRNYSIGGLKSLQTLSVLHIQRFQAVLLKELGELEQLRSMSLIFEFLEEASLLSESINKMKHLEKLYLTVVKPMFHDLHLISPPTTLRKLLLDGTLDKLPKWISMLPNLVKLTLAFSDLSDDPLKSLKKLRNLQSLTMYNCYNGESLHFQDGEFEKLKQLKLEGMRNLNFIVIDEGALQSLEKLTLHRIAKLKAVPSGIQHLKKLEVLTFNYMPRELVNNITPDGGQEHWIIKHVPTVNISTLF